MTYPNPTNLTDIGSLLTYANTVTGNFFGVGIVVALYMIVFLNVKLRGERTPDSFVLAGYISLIPAMILFFMGLFTNAQFFTVLALFIIPIAWSWVAREA